MAQEGGETNLLDLDADGLGKMPIGIPFRISAWLFDYLHEENDAGSSVACL